MFDCVDVERFCQDNPHHPQPPEEFIFSQVRKVATLPGEYDRTCWFHLTRTEEKNKFEQGILPLGQCIESIWNFLYSLACKRVSLDEWANFRCDMGPNHHANLYEMKVNNSREWGPYAILTRDHAFKSKEIGNHDYLGAPEIVEDICICFREKYDVDLLAEFINKTKRCIVKFYDGARDDCVETAVYHLYSVYRGNPCSIGCNGCYDAEGVPVPFEGVLKVEFL